MGFTLLGFIFGLGIPFIILFMGAYLNPQFKIVYIITGTIILNAGLKYMIYLEKLPSYFLGLEIIFIGGYMTYLITRILSGE